jgi:predicted O-linked N-acetylglucosamine transferase (SPINDLY family)
VLHDPVVTPEQLLHEHCEWPRMHAAHLPRFSSWENSPDPGRPLRIGYVCGEFVQGPFAYFLVPVLANHDRGRFEIFSYHSCPFPDAKTAEFRGLSNTWRDISTLDDDSVCELIREDRVDILVDLSGHYPFTRIAVFTRHPAPVQTAFPNYPSTTGVAEIDYILTDRWCAPEDDCYYAERAWRLDSGYLTYLPPPNLPPVGPLPALQNGVVTFGIFQRGAKLNDGVWDAVAAIVHAVPGSRLLVHNANGDIDNPGSRTSAAIMRVLAGRGIAAPRVKLRGDRPLHEHLEIVSQCDVALDTFPYSGQTTTCDCLWMGVPVVTLAGRAHSARVGASIVARAGLEDWIATSPAEYIDIAVRQAAGLPNLAGLRARLREQISNSPVGDHVRVTRAFETAYRSMWRIWCASQARIRDRKL